MPVDISQGKVLISLNTQSLESKNEKLYTQRDLYNIFNRSGVAGVVLQSPPSLSD